MMLRVSELIGRLQGIMREDGDLPVMIVDSTEEGDLYDMNPEDPVVLPVHSATIRSSAGGEYEVHRFSPFPVKDDKGVEHGREPGRVDRRLVFMPPSGSQPLNVLPYGRYTV